MFEEKLQLRIPGPTPVPPRALRALSKPLMGHRSADFSKILSDVAGRMKKVYQTENEVFFMASSGTGAMEAAVANVVEPGDKVIVAVTGVFGDRFHKICSAFGGVVDRIDVEWGNSVDPNVIEERLKANPDTKAVFVTHNETSTGVQNDIEAIGKIVSKYDALFIVDAVSSLGGVEIKTDEWGIDLVAAGSQKALMIPPGLGTICVSDKAWKVIESCKNPRFYFDLKAYRKSWQETTTPFTPAVSLFYALNETLAMIEEEGLEKIFARHEKMMRMVRAAVTALDLKLLASDKAASRTITAVWGDERFDPEKLRKVLKSKYQIVVAGGQKELTGKIFRIGHMGYMDELDMISTIAALELSLKEIGFPVELGAGVRAAQEVCLG